jgi:alpha-glucosidase
MTMPASQPSSASDWWRGAAIYQIYPRSFADSNADGIGDLPGITARLDHVASLGVDAIWISPFYTSPMADFGYDVADYCDVDPIFGTLSDFDLLIARAHALGLKVIVDQVYSHSSEAHPWFTESRSSCANPKADWYVWADPKPDGSPPNNWQSVFGGPSWTWDARRGQYYLHNFLKEQPQLNCANVVVQDALLDVARFWLNREVDGFRFDAFSFAVHDAALTDNPPRPADGTPRSRSFDFQLQVHNQSQPASVDFARRIRALCDEYNAVFTLAEVGGIDLDAEMKRYTSGTGLLDSAYSFDFLHAPALTAALVAETQNRWPPTGETGWPSWGFENHDAARALSRWCTPDQQAVFARLKAIVLVALRGTIIVYQGEELGLDQVDIPFALLRDPEAIANWPLTQSRDGARTPMPWQAQAPNGGFSLAEPWLPLGAENLARAADRQQADPQSLLNLTRELLALRKSNPALRQGDCTILCADEARLALCRDAAEGRTLFVGNLSAAAVAWPEGVPVGGTVLAAVNGAEPGILPAFGGLLIALD